MKIWFSQLFSQVTEQGHNAIRLVTWRNLSLARKLLGEDAAKLGEQLPSHAGYDLLVQSLDRARHSDGPFSGEVVWPDRRLFSTLVTPLAEGGCAIGLQEITHVKDSAAAKSNSHSDLANTQPEIPAHSN